MKLKTIFVTLLLSCALSFGQVKNCPKPVPPPPPPPTPVATNSNVNTNTNSSASSSVASASSNQSQSQTQSTASSATGGNATASNGPQSNSQTVNQNQERQAPALSGGFIVPTASCLGSAQGGVSAPMGGVMFGKSTKDKECNFVRLANEFIAMGNFNAAAKMLCATKSAKEAKLTLDDCLLTVKPVPTPAPAPVSQNVSTSQQVPTVRETQTIVVPVTVQPVVTVLSPPEYKTSIDVYPPKPVAKKKPCVKKPPVGCHYEPSKVVARKLVCE